MNSQTYIELQVSSKEQHRQLDSILGSSIATLRGLLPSIVFRPQILIVITSVLQRTIIQICLFVVRFVGVLFRVFILPIIF